MSGMGGLTSAGSFATQKEQVAAMDSKDLKDLKAKKKRALELMGKKNATGMPARIPLSMDEGPILNEAGDQPAAGRFMNAIAKRRGMKGLKK
ncbi:MAG TPA: hypothetical protein VKZ53_18550 [Candidatus Angelobacter sp.]|nr:hypothetical protein [Candidatus Angelobacter sp.]